jgi:hypothetical protein
MKGPSAFVVSGVLGLHLVRHGETVASRDHTDLSHLPSDQQSTVF